MKELIKKYCRKTGIYYPLMYIRHFPSVVGWLRDGCPSPAPHTVKMNIIKNYLRKYRIDEFIETGTYLGDTLGYIARDMVNCTSIELSEELYKKATERFIKHKNVTLLKGDSAEVLPKFLKQLNKPALFWLDGHFSGGITAKGLKESPVSNELEAVLNHPVSGHVILIDDARCFDGTGNYPFLDDLLNEIRKKGNYKAEVATDIIRLIPAAS